MTTVTLLLSAAPMPMLAFAAMTDIVSRRVPNWASAVIAACGLAARTISGDVLLSVLAALLVFSALFACWIRGVLGGGDVKLLTACTLLVPFYDVPILILSVALAGGVLGVTYLIGRIPRPRTATFVSAPASIFYRVLRVEAWRIRRHAPLPYACAIAAGCVFTLVKG